MSTPTPTKRAVIYTRVSRDDTGEGRSNDRQEDACRKLCELRGWEVVEVIRDVSKSAYAGARPGWKQALSMIEAGDVDILVAWHLDRMTRNMADLEKMIDLSERTGAGIATVSGDIDLTTDVGRMVARILGAVARAEVERKAARQRLANEQRALEGKPHRAGARPFGYEDDHLTIVPGEAEAIREAARRALEGEGFSVLARWLTEKGMLPARGDSEAWTPSGVRMMLTNPRYAGIRVHKGVQVGPAAWEPVLDLETHLQLCEKVIKRSDDSMAGRTGRTPQNLLTGTMKCSKCGDGVVASKKREQETYVCLNNHQYVLRSDADALVLGRTIGRLMHGDFKTATQPQETSGAEAAKASVESLQARLDMLSRMLGRGAMTEDQFEIASSETMTELKLAQTKLKPATRAPELVGIDVGTPRARQQFMDKPLASKRAIVDLLFDIELLPKGRGRRSPLAVNEQVILTPIEHTPLP